MLEKYVNIENRKITVRLLEIFMWHFRTFMHNEFIESEKKCRHHHNRK